VRTAAERHSHRQRRRAGRTLRGRLVLATIALTAAVVVVIGLVSVIALKVFLEQRLDSQLTSAVRRSRAAVDRPNNLGGVPPLLAAPPLRSGRPDFNGASGPGFLLAPGQGAGTVGMTILPDGRVYAAVLNSDGRRTAMNAAQRDRLAAVPVDENPHTVDLGGELGSYRVLAQVAPGRGETIVTGLPLSGVRAAVVQLTAVVAGVGLLGLIGAALIGAAIVRRTLVPLNRVAATATTVSELPLDRGEVALAVRVPAEDTDPRTEVGRVGAALNRMLGHVAVSLQTRQASEERVRRFVADASHELRTPLAAIRGYAELTRRGGEAGRIPPDVAHALSRVESEAIRMTGLVEELLLLARLDEGRPSERLPVDLSRLLVDTLGDAHAAGPDHRWELTLPPEPVVVAGDEPQLHQVLANLLANARVHTPPGTRVEARLSVGGTPGTRDGEGEALLQIVDDGPGISPQMLPEVFERFTRGDSSRSRTAGTTGGTGSTGLGLSIVSAVVAAHGGRVAVTSEPGRTCFAVHLPLSEDPPDGAVPAAERAQVAASTSNATSSRSDEKTLTARSTASATRSAR
jgi:two-component system, OmpR family, sensor kinase